MDINFYSSVFNILDKYLKEIGNTKVKTKYKNKLDYEEIKKQLIGVLDISLVDALLYKFNNTKRPNSNNSSFYLIKFYEKTKHNEFFDEFKKEFKELDRFLKLRINFFNKYFDSILINLDKFREIYKFDNLEEITFNLGDSHSNGKCVCKFKIDGEYFIYKPRSGIVDNRFNKFINSYIPNYGSNIYEFSNFSIHEIVKKEETKTIDDVKKYYYNIGFISCIFYFLNSTDMHYENLILKNTLPIFVDMETIVDITDKDYGLIVNNFFEMISYSILNTMIYPAIFNTKDMEVSALTGNKKIMKDFYYKSKVLVDIDNDNVHFEEVPIEIEEESNLIKLDGNYIHPVNFLEDIQSGFKDFANIVLKSKKRTYNELVKIIDGAYIRQILRPTHIYNKFLATSYDGYYMQNIEYRKELFEILRKSYKSSTKSSSVFEAQIDDEIENLLNGDIPIFYAKPTDRNLYNSKGQTISNNYFNRSCMDLIYNKVHNFDNKTLNQQLDLINSSLFTSAYNEKSDINIVRKREIKTYKHKYMYNLANIIKDTFSEVNEDIISILPFYNGENYILWSYNQSIYESGGIILLHILKNKLCIEDDFFKKIIKTTTRLKVNVDDNIDGFYGLGSSLYLNYYFYKNSKDEFYKLEIESILNKIMKFDLNNVGYDFLTGLSGTLVILSNIYSYGIIENKNIIFIIRSFVKEIMNKKDTIKKELKAGLGHGLSGIILALSTSNRIINEEYIYKYILELIEIEDSYYDIETNNYYDPRDGSLTNFYYCYGLPGILLAKIKLYEYGYDIKSTITEKLSLFIKSILEDEIDLSKVSYCLCHGIGSYTELIIDARKNRLISKSIYDEVMDKLLEAVMNNDNNGVNGNIDILTFMTGKAGKLYSLLRYFYDIPSMLLLDVSTDCKINGK